MNIKKVEPFGKSPNKLLITTDLDQTYRISSFLYADFDLGVGRELSEEETDALVCAINKENTRERAVRMISQSALSERLLKERLIQKGASASDAEEAVSWLHELHLTDDRKTADSIVASAARKGYGRKRIESILFEKKIPKEYWEDALSSMPDSEDAILRFLHQKLDGKIPDDKLIRKTVDALMRRGHSYGDIRDAISRYREDIALTDTDTEELP